MLLTSHIMHNDHPCIHLHQTASPADLDVVVGDVLHLDDRLITMYARVIIVHYMTS